MNNIHGVLALAVACSAVPADLGDSVNRISNGTIAANLQFPYAVSIQMTVNTAQVATRGHRCGGALITFQHVLTAASCMFQGNPDGTRVPINIANYRVFAGANLLTNDTTPDRVRSIAQTIVHPNYLGIPSYLNDIAIVLLTTPFPNNSSVVPLSLPSSNYQPADFTECVIAGWGAATTQSTVTANVEQKYAHNYIYSQQLCTSVYNSLNGLPNIMPTMICAASYDIVSSGCNGDEGNALICDNTLTGVLAFHRNCGASSYPEIYSRVSNYTQWITEVTSSATTFTSGASFILLLTLMRVTFANIFS